MDNEAQTSRLLEPPPAWASKRCHPITRYSKTYYFLLIASVLIILLNYLPRNSSRFSKFSQTSDKVQEFLQISKRLKPKLQLILLEPLFLKKMLREEERKVLVNRNLMPKMKQTSSLEDDIHFITFGIFSQSFDQINNSEWDDFKCETVYSEKWTKRTPNKVASHYFLLKNRTFIHLVVLFKRHQFIRIEAVPQNKRQPFGIQIKDHLSFGSTEQAFDSFSLRNVTIPFYNITVSVPEESDRFLAQMDSSEFIECTRASDEDGNELSPIFLSPFERKAKKGLIEMKKVMKQVKVPIWIAAGTLLGWYRECGIIGHTTDLDFATWSEYAIPAITAQMKSFCFDPRLFQIFGVFENAYEMSFATRDGLKLDLFYVYKESDTAVKMGSHVMSTKSYINYYYPKFNLCSGELLGQRVLVPCNPKAVIAADYGPNWTQPVKDWSYYKSAFNMGPMKRWPSKQPQFQAVRC